METMTKEFTVTADSLGSVPEVESRKRTKHGHETVRDGHDLSFSFGNRALMLGHAFERNGK